MDAKRTRCRQGLSDSIAYARYLFQGLGIRFIDVHGHEYLLFIESDLLGVDVFADVAAELPDTRVRLILKDFSCHTGTEVWNGVKQLLARRVVEIDFP